MSLLGFDALGRLAPGQPPVPRVIMAAASGVFVCSGNGSSFLLRIELPVGLYLVSGSATTLTRDFEAWFPRPFDSDNWASDPIQGEAWTPKTMSPETWAVKPKQAETWTPAFPQPDPWTIE